MLQLYVKPEKMVLLGGTRYLTRLRLPGKHARGGVPCTEMCIMWFHVVLEKEKLKIVTG